jgi:TP901 family phage tail tape measure protein
MSFSGALAQAFVRLRVDSSLVAADTSKGIEEGAAGADVESGGAAAGEKAATAFNKAFKATMIVGLAIAAIGAASLKAGIDFQTQMTMIQTQAGASSAQVKQLSADVLSLAPSTEQGPMQLAEGLYHLKSVGMSNAAAMQALKTASDLAAVGGSNLAQTTNALAGAWRSGISGAQNFGQAAATVNAIVGAGNMVMSQLVGAMGSGFLSTAKTFGVSLTSVGAALALMTDSGVPAQRAATDLKTSISLLGAPSVTAAEQLTQIGLSSTALASAMRSGGLIGAIGLLRAHIKSAGLSAVQTSQLLSRAFGGGESSAAIMLMLNNYDALKKKQDQINEGMSKFGGDVAAQRQTVQAQLDILRSSLETIGVRIGLALLQPATKFVRFLASDLIPAALKLGGILGAVFRNPYADAFIGALLAAMVTIKTIITLMKAWETVTEILKIEFLTSPWGIAIIAVAALAAGIAILWERSSTFRKIVEGAFRAVTDAAKDTWNWIKGHWQLLAAILIAPIAPVLLIYAGAAKLIIRYWSDIWNTLVAPVIRAFEDVKRAITGGFDSWWRSNGKELEEVWEAVWHTVSKIFMVQWDAFVTIVRVQVDLLVTVFKVAWDLVSTIAEIAWVEISTIARIYIGAITAEVRAGWDLISGIFKAAWDLIVAVVRVEVDLVIAIVKIWWDVLVGIFDVFLDLVTGHWGKAWDQVKTTVTQVWNAIKSFLGSAWSDIEGGASRAWNALVSGVKSMASDLWGYFKSIPGMIISALGDVGHLLWNAGRKIIGGLIGGIKSMIGDVTHGIGSVVSAIKSFLPFSPAKQGPLSGRGDPYYSGVSIGKKIAAGITASLPAIKSAVSGSVATINSALSKAAVEQSTATMSLTSLTADKTRLEDLRKTEEQLIKALEAKRKTEETNPADKQLRAEQEAEIKELEKLRKTQESQVKPVEQAAETLRKSMTKLKDQVDDLQTALKKATAAAAAAASSSSSSSSDSSDSSDDSTPDFGALSQWLAETASTSGAAAGGGGWQGNPGPFGGFGLAFNPGTMPGPVGGFNGAPPGFGRKGGGDPSTAMVIDRLDTVISTLRAQPAKNAAGMANALNGVSGTAIVRGNW